MGCLDLKYQEKIGKWQALLYLCIVCIIILLLYFVIESQELQEQIACLMKMMS